MSMETQLLMVLALLGTAIVMFAINRPRMDAVALIMLTALPFTGVITINEALVGFSDANIVLIAALFVIGDGLVRTGVARQLGDWLAKTAGSSENRLIALLMLVVCGLGSTMSSTAVTAIFIPVVLRISRGTSIPASQLMMPLSFAALISGMMTLVATAPNLVVNSELTRPRPDGSSFDGFQFFSFTPFGLPILALAIIYMLTARRWLLPVAESQLSASEIARPSLAGWVKLYDLHSREHRVRVLGDSPLADKTLEELRLRDTSGASLVAIQRNQTLIQPTAKTQIATGDILLIDFCASDTSVAQLREHYRLESLPLSGGYFTDQSQEIGMAEVILPADSDLVGQTVTDARLRDRTRLTVIGIRRGSTPLGKGIESEVLQVGDTLLLVGPWQAIRNVQQTGGLVPLSLPKEYDDVLPVPGKSIQAIACLLLTIGLMVSGVVPNVQAALIGCLLMGVLGCVNLESSYRSIDWKTIVLIVGMLPFSTALQRTGGVDLASEGLMTVTSGVGTHGVLAAIFIITAALGMFISNTATAVLMAPVAMTIAKNMDASPYPFAMIVALAASTAFMTPVSSPVNTLVVTPGNYSFGDFVRVGVPFSILVMIVSVFLVPWLLPLY